MSDLLHVLGDLPAGEQRPIRLETALEAHNDIGRAGPPVKIEGQVTATATGAVVNAVVSAELDLICMRCLRKWSKPVEVQVDAVFEPVADPDVFPISEGVIDLEQPVRDEMLVAIADSSLHDEGCKGLCGTCGFDLNMGVCECPEVELSSPFAALKDLFDS